METKQIGWKLKESCLQYEKAACDIAFGVNSYAKTLSVFPRTNENFSTGSACENRLKTAGVLELWFTPVYEEVCKDKAFTLNCTGGLFNLTVLKKGFLYVPDNKILSISFIKDIVKNGIARHKDYEFVMHVSHIDMGCKKAVPVKDIQQCIDYWEENFNK